MTDTILHWDEHHQWYASKDCSAFLTVSCKYKIEKVYIDSDGELKVKLKKE